MSSGTLSGIITLVAMIAFVGVFFWAWSSRRRDEFEDMAHLPLQDGEEAVSNKREHEE